MGVELGVQVAASLPGGALYALRREKVGRKQMAETLEDHGDSSRADAR